MTDYPVRLSPMDIVLIADMLDYVMKHFEADDDETAERFDQACASLQAKMLVAARGAGLSDAPAPPTNDSMLDFLRDLDTMHKVH